MRGGRRQKRWVRDGLHWVKRKMPGKLSVCSPAEGAINLYYTVFTCCQQKLVPTSVFAQSTLICRPRHHSTFFGTTNSTPTLVAKIHLFGRDAHRSRVAASR